MPQESKRKKDTIIKVANNNLKPFLLLAVQCGCFQQRSIEQDHRVPGKPVDAESHGFSLVSWPAERFPTLRETEDYLIAEALRISRNNQGVAASMLGLTRQALNKRLIRKNTGKPPAKA